MTEQQRDLARAFQRLIEEDDFAGRVVNDPDGALADYDLTEEQRSALLSDADALEGDVEGFAFKLSFAQVIQIGGLRSPSLLGGQIVGGAGGTPYSFTGR